RRRGDDRIDLRVGGGGRRSRQPLGYGDTRSQSAPRDPNPHRHQGHTARDPLRTGARRRRQHEPGRSVEGGDGRLRRADDRRVPGDRDGDRAVDQDRGQGAAARTACRDGGLRSGGRTVMTVATDAGAVARTPAQIAQDTILVLGTISAEEVRLRDPRGIIFSGGPASVFEPGAPHPDPKLYDLDIPILGICYGMDLLAVDLGGVVAPAERREYGHASVTVDEPAGLFAKLPAELAVWMSHGDVVTELPTGF